MIDDCVTIECSIARSAEYTDSSHWDTVLAMHAVSVCRGRRLCPRICIDLSKRLLLCSTAAYKPPAVVPRQARYLWKSLQLSGVAWWPKVSLCHTYQLSLSFSLCNPSLCVTPLSPHTSVSLSLCSLSPFSLAILSLSLPPCLLYTSPSPRDASKSRMPSSA